MLKIFGADGSKKQSSLMRMQLLVQNEAGEIITRGLTQYENHDKSAAILELVISKVKLKSDEQVVCVCDNAVQTRSLMTWVFVGNVDTKQGLLHVIQRLTEKVKEHSERCNENMYRLMCLCYFAQHNFKTGVRYEKNISFVGFD